MMSEVVARKGWIRGPFRMSDSPKHCVRQSQGGQRDAGRVRFSEEDHPKQTVQATSHHRVQTKLQICVLNNDERCLSPADK